MDPITSAQEDQVIAAVKKAVAMVDDGTAPNDAIEKVARENDWGHHMVRFASQAYNTGRQNFQRDSNDSVLDKMAEFPLADPDKIIQAIWPSNVKTASELQRQEVSAHYSQGPEFIEARYNAEAANRLHTMLKKEAKEVKPEQEAPPTPPQLFNKRANLRRALDESRRRYTQRLDKLKGLAGAVGSYFRQSPVGRMKFAEYELCAAEHIPGCNSFLDHVHSFYKVAEDRATATTFAEYD